MGRKRHCRYTGLTSLQLVQTWQWGQLPHSAPSIRLPALTHRMSVRAWILAHWRRWGLHPGWRHAIRVGGHRRASHAWHWGREAVRSSGHAVVASVLGWSRIHPRRPVMLQITYTFRFQSRLFPSQGNESSILAADHRWLATVSSRWPRRPALVDGMSSRGGDWSLSQFGHEWQVLLVHTCLVLCWLRRLTARWSVCSKWATHTHTHTSV